MIPARRRGIASGGPTHVLMSDDVAEHIPAATWRSSATSCSAPRRFRSLYRLGRRRRRYLLALPGGRYNNDRLSPSAVFWHFRRNTVKAYLDAAARLRQCRGAGLRQGIPSASTFGQAEMAWPSMATLCLAAAVTPAR